MSKLFPGLMLVAGLLFFNSCKESQRDLQQAYDHVKGITGTWKLYNIVQVDYLVSPADTFNINSFVLGTISNSAELKFNSDKTFTYTANGSTTPFAASGTWAFDDESAPATVTFTSGTNTMSVNLLISIRTFDTKLNLGINNCDSRFAVKYAFLRK